MPYIYKYTDAKDGIVKYVGLIRSDTNFPKRFFQHKRDHWYKGCKWIVEYASVNSICDAEALEGHFIAYYHTDNYYNTAKAAWGLLSFAPEVEWEKFGDPDFFYTEWGAVNHWALDQRVSWAQEQIYDIEEKIRGFDHQCEVLTGMLEKVYDEARKKKFEDVRNWIRNRVKPPELYGDLDTVVTSWDEAYKDFCTFLGVPEKFVSIDDFVKTVDASTVLPKYAKHTDGISVGLYGEGEKERTDKALELLAAKEMSRINIGL